MAAHAFAAPALQHLVRAALPPLEGGVEDLLLPLYIGLGVLLVRLAAEALLLPPLRRALGPYAPPHRAARVAYKTFDNAFTSLSAGLMTLWAWRVTFADNGGCTPFSTRACLANWPDIPVSYQFRLVWLTIFGFYAYEMIGTALGVGCRLSGEMVVHHVITMWMMLYGYFYSLHRYGLMATAVLDTSNTLLHAAKALNYANVPSLEALKDAAFKAFALCFFVCRVVLPPFSMVYPGLRDGVAMPAASYVITNALMLFIYGLQLFWFAKIVRIARGGAEHDARGGASGASSGAASPLKAPSSPLKPSSLQAAGGGGGNGGRSPAPKPQGARPVKEHE